MSNEKNLTLWKLVETTNTDYTKKAKKSGREFTSITPMSQFKKATEVFGIQGIGWGIKIGSEIYTESTYKDVTLLNYDAVMFFNFNGSRGEIPIHSSIPIAYKTNGYQGKEGYFKTDDDARKKVVTNAKTKGLSDLGFNADIFMGKFDDYDYYQEMKMRSDHEKQSQNEGKVIEGLAGLEDEFNKYCNRLAEAENITTLNVIYKSYVNNIERKCKEVYKNVELRDKKFSDLKGKLIEIKTETQDKLKGE